MDDGISTPAQMIAALDRWARARGMLRESGAKELPASVVPHLELRDRSATQAKDVFLAVDGTQTYWEWLPADTVLAWALVYELADRETFAEFSIWHRLSRSAGDNFMVSQLAVRADQLLAAGDPLGEILTWLLTLWSASPPDLRHTADAVSRLEVAANRHYWSGPLATAETMLHLPEHHPTWRSERAMMAIQLARRTPWTQVDAMHVVDAWYRHTPAVTLDQWTNAVMKLGLAAVEALGRSDGNLAAALWTCGLDRLSR